jgi:hypothetical protein
MEGRPTNRERPITMQTVQVSIADGNYATAVGEALSRKCAWHVKAVERPDLSAKDVIVLDQAALERLPLPLDRPERIVLVTHKNPELLAEAWEAGIVSVVSDEDPIDTVLLAIMAAGLRLDRPRPASSEISPSSPGRDAPISSEKPGSGSKCWKMQ